MFVALWEFEVKPGCEKRFEKVYGPEGDWARLFRRHPQYQETRLVRDVFRRGVYLTMDFWQSRATYEEFMEGHRKEYEEIEVVGEALTLKERQVGWFESIEGGSQQKDQ
jgi:heme-degrading monooxygenase HmoA